MADLESIINRKAENDTAWKEQRQAERENTAEMRDAGIVEITSHPETYLQYLEMQGNNPTYSAGNIALVLFQMPEAKQVGTYDRWKSMGRSVLESERGKGAKIFARANFPAKGYTIADAYDISQTQGRAVREIHLHKDTKEMEAALTTLLNYSPAEIEVNRELDGPALYDPKEMKLVINPDFDDELSFPPIAAEIAQARFHAKGANAYYDRAESTLDAESVSYLLCKRFGVQRDLPDAAHVAALYEGWESSERSEGLDRVQNMAKQIGGSIERGISPQQRGRLPVARPGR